jgi:phosphohistidine swiveling domain-containing protein
MKNFKKLNTMKAEKGKGVETAKKHKKYVKDKLETAKGYIQEMTGISSKKDLLDASLATNPVTAGVTAGVKAIKNQKILKISNDHLELKQIQYLFQI